MLRDLKHRLKRLESRHNPGSRGKFCLWDVIAGLVPMPTNLNDLHPLDRPVVQAMIDLADKPPGPDPIQEAIYAGLPPLPDEPINHQGDKQ